MSKLNINIGSKANDKSGDTLRTAFDKINQNFSELYTLTGGSSTALTELAQDYAAPMFNHASHTNITATYDDANNKILLTGVASAVWPVANTAGASGPTKVAIGFNAGLTTQGPYAVAIGAGAGNATQGDSAVAVGIDAGKTTQGANAVAVGIESGRGQQGAGSVAVGYQAAFLAQGANAVAVGKNAGSDSQGANAVAVGNSAGRANQPANTIILNASGSTVNGVASQTNSFYVSPIRSATATSDVLYYNTTTKEVTYGSMPSAYTLPTATTSVLGGIKIGTGLSIDVNGVVTASAGGGSALVNGARTVSLGSDGTLTLPAQSATLTDVNQIVSAKIYRAGASTDTVTIQTALDNWMGAEFTWIDLRDQDAQINAPRTRPWAGMPSYQAYQQIMLFNPTGGQLPPPGNMAPTAKTASDAYLTYKELQRNIDIVAGNNTFSFENTGALRVPGVITKNNNLTLVSVGTTVYQQLSDQGLPVEVRNDESAAVVVDGENGRVFIRTDDGTTLRTWQFDVNGGLTLPGDLTLPSGGSIQSATNPNTQAKVTLTPYRVLSQVRTNTSQTYSVGSGDFTSASGNGSGIITFVGLQSYVAQFLENTLDSGNVYNRTVQINGAGLEYQYINFNGTNQINLNVYPTAGAVSTVRFSYTLVSKIDIYPDDGVFKIESEPGLDIDIQAGRTLDMSAITSASITSGTDMDLRSGTGPVNISTNYPGFGQTPTLQWQFGNNGSLTLPLGGTIAEGGGLTGAIKLTPAGGANANQALLIYPTAAGDGDHVHLTAGGGTTELYLGDDSRYVKLVNGGNIEVRATTANASASAAWTFGTDGAVSTTDPLIINVPNGVPTGVGVIAATTNTWAQDPATNLATTGGSGTGLRVSVTHTGGFASAIAIATAGTGYLDGELITVTSGGSSASFTIAVTGTRSWTFGITGNTTFPTGLVLGAPRGVNTVNFTCSVDKEFQIETGTASAGRLWQFGTAGNTTFPSGLTLHRLSTPYSNITADLDKILQVATQTSGGRKEWTFGTDGVLTVPGNIVNSTGVSQLANRVEGSWTVLTGTSIYSFTVPMDGTYTMWVKGNIPNGIITWNATVSVSNTNVPAIGYQYAWNYTGGGTPISLTSIPNQIKGASGAISTDATYAGSTSNRFDFGINNTSGANQTVYYGYTRV